MKIAEKVSVLDKHVMDLAKRLDALPRDLMDADDFEKIEEFSKIIASIKVVLIQAGDLVDNQEEIPETMAEIFSTCEMTMDDIENALGQAEEVVKNIQKNKKQSQTALSFINMIKK